MTAGPAAAVTPSGPAVQSAQPVHLAQVTQAVPPLDALNATAGINGTNSTNSTGATNSITGAVGTHSSSILSTVATAPTSCTGTSPKGLYSSTLTFTVATITPEVVTAGGPAALTVTGTMTNSGERGLSEIGYKFQRGDALVGEAAIRNEAAHPCQPITVVNSGFVGIDDGLAAGASMPFSVSVPIPGTDTTTLAVTDPGVYPVMINFNATVGLSSGDVRARVGEIHLLLTVLSVPAPPAHPGSATPDGASATFGATATAIATTGTATSTTAGSTANTATGSGAAGSGAAGATGARGSPHTPVPYSMVWAMVDRPHLGVGGVFLDDSLASEISPGGALYEKLQTMTTTTQVANSLTIAIDPELLDELDRMSRGYWVVAPPGSTQAPLTPTANGTSTSSPSTTRGPSTTGSTTNTGSTTSETAEPGAGGSMGGSPSSLGDGSGGVSSATNPPASPPGATAQSDAANAGAHGGGASGGQSAATTDLSTDAASLGTAATGTIATGTIATGTMATGTGPVTSLGDTALSHDTSPANGTSSAGETSPPGGTAATAQETASPKTTAPETTPERTTSETGQEAAPPAQPPGTVAGTGQAAAAAFLDHLRRLATTTSMLVLPYSDADTVALVRAGMTETLATSVYLGQTVAARVLGVNPTSGASSTLITDLAYPVGGLTDPATLSALHDLGVTGAILAPAGVTGMTGGSGVATVKLPATSGGTASSVAALVPDSSLLTDITPLITGGLTATSASTLNLIAGVIAGQYFTGTGQPLLVVPDRTWTPNRDGLGAVTSLLATLSSEGVVAGTDLRALAATPSGTASVVYPADAQTAELSASLLRRVERAGAQITSMRASLTAVPGPDGGDPADILDPLEQALIPLTSASFRDNRDPADRVLSTVDSSLRTIEAGVTVPTSGGSLTLASSSAPLRLTVANTLPYDVRLRLVIGGGLRVGLTTTDPGIVEVPAGRSVPIKVTAHVARSGTFSITAQLVTPDGRTWGSPVTLQVNSRAYGVLTLVLLLVAGSVLVLMVVIRLVQRSRSRRRTPGRGTSGPGDGHGGGHGGGSGGGSGAAHDGIPHRNARDGTRPDPSTPGGNTPDDGRMPVTSPDPPDAVHPAPAGPVS